MGKWAWSRTGPEVALLHRRCCDLTQIGGRSSVCNKMVMKSVQLLFPRQLDGACVASGRQTGHREDGNLAGYQT